MKILLWLCLMYIISSVNALGIPITGLQIFRSASKKPISHFTIALRSESQQDDLLNDIYLDRFLIEVGGYSSFQTSLFRNLGIVYSIIGSDTFFTAFLTHALSKSWDLTIIQQGYIGSTWFLGSLVGHTMSSFLNDKIGSNKLLKISIIIHFISTILTFLCPNLISVLLCRFISSFATAITFNCIFPLLFELIPNAHKVSSNQHMSIMWNIGISSLGIFIFILRDLSWRWWFLAFLPSMLYTTLHTLHTIPSSASQLISEGNTAELSALLHRIILENNCTDNVLVNDMLHSILCTVEKKNTNNIKNMDSSMSKDESLSQLQQLQQQSTTSSQLSQQTTSQQQQQYQNSYKFLWIGLLNFSTSMAYYGLALGSFPLLPQPHSHSHHQHQATPSSASTSSSKDISSLSMEQIMIPLGEIPMLLVLSPLTNYM
eukprot:gene13074-27595_t